CTPPCSPTTRRSIGTAAARPPPTGTAPTRPPPLRPRRRDGLACGRPRAVVSRRGGGAAPAACWPSARRWRGPWAGPPRRVPRPWAREASAQLPANSVSLIDSAGGRVGAAVPVGSPDGLAYGRGSVWAVDGTDGKLFRIDPVTHAIIDHIDVGSDPSAVTVSR